MREKKKRETKWERERERANGGSALFDLLSAHSPFGKLHLAPPPMPSNWIKETNKIRHCNLIC